MFADREHELAILGKEGPPVMKVVIGTDFSENAKAAGLTAAALARRWSHTLAVAHVFDDSMSDRLPGDVRWTLAASTSDRLHSEVVHLGSEGVKVEEHMLSGAPEQALADLATQSDARLVVVTEARSAASASSSESLRSSAIGAIQNKAH